MKNNKQNNAAETEATNATTENNQLPAMLDANGQDLNQLFEHFEQQDTAVMRGLDAEYLKLEENKIYNFVFGGFETATIEGEEKQVCTLYDKQQNKFISAAAVLVSNCKKITPPQLIRIVTAGKIAGANGKYLSMQVYTL